MALASEGVSFSEFWMSGVVDQKSRKLSDLRASPKLRSEVDVELLGVLAGPG
jgi:hypothetical protein